MACSTTEVNWPRSNKKSRFLFKFSGSDADTIITLFYLCLTPKKGFGKQAKKALYQQIALKIELLGFLTAGWGEGAITEFKLEYLYGPEAEVSGE